MADEILSIAPRRPADLRPRETQPRPQQVERAGPPDISLADCLAVVLRRRRLVLAVVAACVVVAMAYSVLATPIYEGRARILIAPDAARVVTFSPVVEESQADVEFYQTQYEVLRSRSLARKALERLHLADASVLEPPPSMFSRLVSKAYGLWSPAPAAAIPPSPVPAVTEGQVSALLGSLSISPVRQSRLVDVNFRSSDPQLAARVADTVASAYIDQNLELRRHDSQAASEWLRDRLAELRQQVDTREQALQQYREKQDAVSLDDRQNIVVQKLSQLDTAVTAARTERIGKETVFEQLQAMQQSGAPLDTLPVILDNPLIQRLKGEVATLQRERAQLAEQLGELHPDRVKLEASITNAERRLQAEIASSVAAVRNDYAAAQARERALRNALEEQKQVVLNLNRQSIGYSALKRDAASTEQMFEGVLQRMKETDLSGELQTNNARMLDSAIVPGAPVWPRTSLNVAVAVFGGLFLGLGLVIVLEYMNPRMVTPGDVGDTLGLPLLGVTPKVRAHMHDPAQIEPGTAAAGFQESLRSIRTNILLSPAGASMSTLAVTSTGMGEGKTVVATNLAISMALAGRRVLLIDADLRRPGVHHVFKLSRGFGLADLIATEAPLASALRDASVRGLTVVTAGSYAASPADLLESDHFKELLRHARESFDLVVLDCPPVMAVADAVIVANAASSVLFVVGSDATHRDVAQVAIDRLVAAQANVIGVVLNKVDVKGRAEYYQPYYEDTEHAEPKYTATTQRTGTLNL